MTVECRTAKVEFYCPWFYRESQFHFFLFRHATRLMGRHSEFRESHVPRKLGAKHVSPNSLLLGQPRSSVAVCGSGSWVGVCKGK